MEELREAKHKTCGTTVIYRRHRHTRSCYDNPGPAHGAPFLVCTESDVAHAWCATCLCVVDAGELDVEGPHAFAQVS